MSMDRAILGLLARLDRLERGLDRAGSGEVPTSLLTLTGHSMFQGGFVGTTSLYGTYQIVGKLCLLTARAQATGAGTAGFPVLLALPFSAAAANALMAIGSAVYLDNGTTIRIGTAVMNTTNTIGIQCDGKAGLLGSASDALTMASTDQMAVSVMFELA